MGSPAKVRDARYTYADYLGWSDDERWELIGGVAYNMTPAPSRRHQEISGALFLQLAGGVRGGSCRVYAAPFDVRLPAPGETDAATSTVVQPDLVVVCDLSKLDDRGCKGPPDLVIEILSPETAARDLKDKFLLYEKAGVPEYWVVYPAERIVMVFRRWADGAYGRPERYASDDRITASALPKLEIDLAPVFAD